MNDTSPNEEQLAFMLLKEKIVKLMYEFVDGERFPGNVLQPRINYILVDVLTSCLSEAQYQTKQYMPFTQPQEMHICYQIGDWYMQMKPLLEGQHNLGYMKERLKTMICGD